MISVPFWSIAFSVTVPGTPTLTVTVATLESSSPSLALNVNVSRPVKPPSGVYVTSGAVPESVPFDGWFTIEYTRSSPSGSVATSVIATGVSSSVITSWSSATGGPSTVNVTATWVSPSSGSFETTCMIAWCMPGPAFVLSIVTVTSTDDLPATTPAFGSSVSHVTSPVSTRYAFCAL